MLAAPMTVLLKAAAMPPDAPADDWASVLLGSFFPSLIEAVALVHCIPLVLAAYALARGVSLLPWFGRTSPPGDRC